MKDLFLALMFVNILLPCHAQFNTVSRDTMPIRLIGQEDMQMPASGRQGVQQSGQTTAASQGNSSREVSGNVVSGRETSGQSGTSQGLQGQGNPGQGVMGQPGGQYGDGSALSDGEMGKYYEMPLLQGSQPEGMKKKSLWDKVFGRKKKPKVPQIIIMPMQTISKESKSRKPIEQYDETLDEPPYDLSVSDLERLDLLSQRSTVSMPLQRFYLTSKFGYRRDPLGQGTRFHDGVDLRCSYEPVYAMLPGVVTKVQHGNTGYGNYVVLNHGNIECLYGHLSDIGVEVGEAVQAGDVVAISGNSGRSTGPHLHLKMTYMGQRVDPLVFIDYINDYIKDLQDKLYGGSKVNETADLTVENLLSVMEHYGLHHQSIVLSQALLETGWFSSPVCLNKHNLFGLTRRDGQYYEFATWQESVKGYRDMIQYRYKGGDYYEFLRRVPYAEDPNYINKVKNIERQLGGYGLRIGEGGE